MGSVHKNGIAISRNRICAIWNGTNNAERICANRIGTNSKCSLFTGWSNHQLILNRCKTNEERLSYIIYSKKELLGYKQLERAIKTDAMASILRAKDIQSEALHTTYAKSPALFKDTAYICSAIFGRFKSLLRSFSAIFGHTCGRSCSHCGRSRLFSVVLYRWFFR